MFVYRLDPIDFWAGWMSEADYEKQLVAQSVFDLHQAANGWDAYVAEKVKAFDLARKIGWEGDIRDGPFIAALPTGDGADDKVMIAWKQDSNGTTFVASPYVLSWLDGRGIPQITA